MKFIKSKIKYLLSSIQKSVSRNGFTLIELLVSITIFGLISTMVVVNFRGGQKQDFLNLSADEIVSNIKKAQTAAVTGELINGEVPAGGFGLHFEKDADSYVYFADDGTHIYNGDLILQEYSLQESVYIDTSIDIVFDPPRPTVYFNNDTLM